MISRIQNVFILFPKLNIMKSYFVNCEVCIRSDYLENVKRKLLFKKIIKINYNSHGVYFIRKDVYKLSCVVALLRLYIIYQL